MRGVLAGRGEKRKQVALFEPAALKKSRKVSGTVPRFLALALFNAKSG
jgi:hypothetical protein